MALNVDNTAGTSLSEDIHLSAMAQFVSVTLT